MKTFSMALAGLSLLTLVGSLTAKEDVLEPIPQASAPNVPAARSGGGAKSYLLSFTFEEKALRIMAGMKKDTTYPAWTFNGQMPGPIFRVREGDTVEVDTTNSEKCVMPHNVDLHSVSGPGGGAPITLAAPGETKKARFKMLNPGVFIYHCAAPPVTWHIANGMYGLIIVDPKGGLPKVDREYYVMQSELYTKAKFGTEGLQEFDPDAAQREQPTYIVFNGAVDGLVGPKALKAKVGETVRIWFGNGGPNLVASWHVIGVIFETLYNLGSFDNPLKNVQTTLVPAGGACAADFKLKVPGKYTFVDHSIFRIQKGAAGFLEVEGPANPEIYQSLGTVAAKE